MNKVIKKTENHPKSRFFRVFHLYSPFYAVICFFCFFGAFAVNIAMNIMLKYFTFLSENEENNTTNHKKRYF